MSDLPCIEFQNVTKSFGSFFANQNVSFSIGAGKLHAIAGENGAGKSTLMKILFGLECPDSGRILLDGRAVSFRSPKDAIASGIGMVHQHFVFADQESMLNNIIFGAEPLEKGFLSNFVPPFLLPIAFNSAEKHVIGLAKSELQGTTVSIDNLGSPISELSIGLQQETEILKLLYRDVNILILDEPTAVLSPNAIEGFYQNLQALCKKGKTVVVITHKINEILNYCDSVTVLRQGRCVSTNAVKESTAESIAFDMVGRKIANLSRAQQPKVSDVSALDVQGSSAGAVVFQLSNFGIPKFSPKSLSLTLKAGEILGIAGVDGNGQAELLLHLNQWIRQTQVNGGFVASDRHHQGLLIAESVTDNCYLGLSKNPNFFNSMGMMRNAKILDFAQRCIEIFGISGATPEKCVGQLSGGNQQKLVLAREMLLEPKILIVAQPTRGVDIGAIEFIHQKILEQKSLGRAILLVSNELDELFFLSDRLQVIHQGEFVGSFERGNFDEVAIGCLMGGLKP